LVNKGKEFSRRPDQWKGSSYTKRDFRTFRRVSPAGALVSSFGIASLNPRTRSGGVRGFDLKKFMVGARVGNGGEDEKEWLNGVGAVKGVQGRCGISD
jgi:hypothetical protein